MPAGLSNAARIACLAVMLLPGCGGTPAVDPVIEIRIEICPAVTPTPDCPDFPELGARPVLEDLEDGWLTAREAHTRCRVSLDTVTRIIESCQQGSEE